MNVIGWAAYETVYHGIVNFNLAGHTWAEARELVTEGEKHWALLGGGVLALVDPEARLGPWEYFVIEVATNRFEKALT
jgi:hypothetical protein